MPRKPAADGARGAPAGDQLSLALGAPAPPAGAPAPAGARLLLAPGPRAAEARLLEEVLAASRAREQRLQAGDLTALRAPLRVVVPSRSLRQHVAARLVAAAGRSLVGVSVQTHTALALEALARAGQSAPRGAALVPLLVRRHAAEEEALARWLGELEDGFGIVEAAVRDLLDAGFGAPLAEPLGDAIAEVEAAGGLGAPAAARARAVAAVALRTQASLAAEGLGHRTELLAVAREALEDAGDDAARLLPTAGLWLHGYADATGLVSDWLEALVRAFDGRVLIDVPPDPAEPGRREDRYPADLRLRMGRVTGGEAPLPPAPAPRLALLHAPGTEAEVRAVAVRVRALLDGGAAPEAIGVVARQIEPYRGALHAQLGRLAIPFTATGASAGPDRAGRRAAALAGLLREGRQAPVDTWLAADASRHGADVDLRIALHVLGAGRLERVAALDLARRLGDATALRLPVRRGGALASVDEEAEEEAGPEEGAAPATATRAPARNRHRYVSIGRLAEAAGRARRLLAWLDAWPSPARFDAHLTALRELLEGELCWRSGLADCAPLLEALDALAGEVPPGFALAREELGQLVQAALADAAGGALGGEGAGVQVLTVTAARGRSFEHLFLLGLNRNGFPRAPSDDPVLPDALRRRLRAVLAEMPVKERVRDEERHLFASLCAAAPAVTLAWQHADDEGRARVESPFVVRLEVLRPELVAATAPAPQAADAGGEPAVPRPPDEHLLLAGLRRDGAPLAGVRACALGAVRAVLRDDRAIGDPRTAALDLAALARHHDAVQRELDAAPGGPAVLGPWFGRVGRRADGDASDPYVTRLEALARCPWQAFLRRDLGLEPVPDALAALPAPDALLLGQVAHAALERIVSAAGAPVHEPLADVLARGPVRVAWPDEAQLEAWLLEAAEDAALAEGIALPGFARALARRVRPLVDAARVDWDDADGLAVLGAELTAAVEITDTGGRRRRIAFRADRADLEDGVLRLTDYKTGALPCTSEAPDTRHRHLLRAVREGKLLQAAAYRLAAAALAPGGATEGRYLYLREDPAIFAVRDDAYGTELADAFHATAGTLLDAADRGLQPPRLEGGEGQAPCKWCEVRAACLQGESAHRARLTAWIESAQAQRAAGALDPAEAALLRVARLREDAKEAGVDDAAVEEGEA